MIKEDRYMFCLHCNNPVEDDNTFCGVCGTPMELKPSESKVREKPALAAARPRAGLAPTLYAVPPASQWQKGTTMVDPEGRVRDGQAVGVRSTPDKTCVSALSDSPRKQR